MAVRWNGVLIENPGILRRPSAWEAFNLRLEHSAIRWAFACMTLGALAGRLSAPALGY